MNIDSSELRRLLLCTSIALFLLSTAVEGAMGTRLLDPNDFAIHVEYFNDPETWSDWPGWTAWENELASIIPNEQSWDWMVENIPFFECPDAWFEQIYYFRWWSFRKHIKYPTNYGYQGYGITEWVEWSNPNSSPFSHHIAEARRRVSRDLRQFLFKIKLSF